MSDLKTIGRQYRVTRRVLTKHIERLKQQPKSTKRDYDLSILRSMERDCRETGRESYHYYDEGWWRSERYTHNRR